MSDHSPRRLAAVPSELPVARSTPLSVRTAAALGLLAALLLGAVAGTASAASLSQATSLEAICPQAAVESKTVPTPLVNSPASAATVSNGSVSVDGTVQTYGSSGSTFVRFGESPGYLRCSQRVPLSASTRALRVELRLSGLIPKATYHFELGATTAGGTSYGPQESFTAPAATVPAGVTIGPISLGGQTKALAFQRLQKFIAAPLRFAFEGTYWSAPRARLGAEIHPDAAFARALAAQPGSHLPLELTINQELLSSYLAQLNLRLTHAAAAASIRLVGRRAVVVAGAPSVTLEVAKMAASIRTALNSGLSERLAILVDKRRMSGQTSAQTAAKAVVIRLGSQTLTAYLNGKPVLRTPITTGRAALPTPVGNYHIIFRASPFVFHSPWPAGSPFWYPPTPVTWAMDFVGGDFLHDDPAEPTSAFGAGSEYGPYASHGCVHVPHSVMAFLYGWLPVGSQVVVAQD